MRALYIYVSVGLLSCAPSEKPSVAAKKQAACGQASDETVRVMRALAPHCEGCHVTGARAFFSSVSSFQNLIVSDMRLIKPGDPANSEFVKLLEGTGTGAFTRMPIGTRSYAELVAAGTATLTIDEVKQWVTGLATQARDARPDSNAPRITRVRAEQVQRALYQQLGLVYADFFVDASDFGIPRAEARSDDLYPFQPADEYLAPRGSEARDRFHGLGGGSVVTQQKADPSISPTFVLTLTQVSQRWCRLGYRKMTNDALFPNGATKATDEANVKATITRWFLHFHGRVATPAEVDAMYTNVWTPLAGGGAEAGFTGLCSAFVRHPDWIFY
ncbi:MAG: hypothetical protein JNM17_03535 [Archangium sp.]|nr:hypothetical protein [Archangium sp.]